MVDQTRRKILKTGAVAAAVAAVRPVLAQQNQQGTAAGKFYERGAVRIYYEEAGSGFPLLLLPPGGLNARIAGIAGNNPYPGNAINEFKGEVSLHHGGPSQRARRPIHRPCRSRSAVGCLC